ncbi:V-type proton ATPase subunit d-like isoform X2 [Zophobas morio]|uniref:V-type proton ATPase subunit d-like isoform X2 n=1 Tax=Zophobas morio TaxID=2755281 RepID=UPI003083BCED
MLFSFLPAFFNVDNGYTDGLCRGFKSSILTKVDYANLRQCETLEDIKLHLKNSEYGILLSTEPEVINVATLSDKLQEHLVNHFKTLRTHSVEPTTSFLNYITYSYMIDNIILLLSGFFDSIGSLTIASSPEELYNLVLIDTPLAPYFKNCLTIDDLNGLNIEIIRNLLYKSYIEDFVEFCLNLGGETAEVMKEILAFEADRRAFIITINSFGTELKKEERIKLFPHYGRLYPEGLSLLANCDSYEQVREVAGFYSEYNVLFECADLDTGRTLEDMFYEYEVALNKRSFLSHFNLGIYYSYVRLKEQECRNIVWISECVCQNHKAKIDNFIPIY